MSYENEPKWDAAFIAMIGWGVALIMLATYISQPYQQRARDAAIDKIPACVVRPFNTDRRTR